MNDCHARLSAQAFLSALQDAPWEFWRKMPVEWTAARTLARQQGLSPQAANARLRTLEAAGCIERRRRGQFVEYRPFEHLVMDQQIVRRTKERGA